MSPYGTKLPNRDVCCPVAIEDKSDVTRVAPIRLGRALRLTIRGTGPGAVMGNTKASPIRVRVARRFTVACQRSCYRRVVLLPCATGIVNFCAITSANMGDRKYLTAEEVSERYRCAVSVGTLRNWRATRRPGLRQNREGSPLSDC